MKQLTDDDILAMASGEYRPDSRAVNRAVRAQLRLGQLIPPPPAPVPEHYSLDLHQKTVETAWGEIMSLAKSGVRTATIITGASGVLHEKFPGWATDSILSPYIIEWHPINNGSFFVRFRRRRA